MTYSNTEYIEHLHAIGSKAGTPVTGTFELTSRCNFNCKMCYIHDSDCNKNKDLELSTEQWLKIAKSAQKAGVIILLLTGGEPLIRDDFCEIYKNLCEMGFIIHLNTNGSLFTEEIFNLFYNYPPAVINISVYGAGEESYKNLCGNNSFNTVIENIKRLKEMGINVRFNCTFNPYTKKDIASIIRLSKELNCDIRTDVYTIPNVASQGVSDSHNHTYRFSPEEAAKALLETEKEKNGKDGLIDYCKRFRKSIEMMSSLNLEPTIDNLKPSCKAGKTSFWIDWQGKMMACGLIPREGTNLTKTSFNDAWTNVKSSMDEMFMSDKCLNCKYRLFCNNCISNAIAETGKSNIAPEYLCEMYSHIDIETQRILKEENLL